jgi:hypothetical protein
MIKRIIEMTKMLRWGLPLSVVSCVTTFLPQLKWVSVTLVLFVATYMLFLIYQHRVNAQSSKLWIQQTISKSLPLPTELRKIVTEYTVIDPHEIKLSNKPRKRQLHCLRSLLGKDAQSISLHPIILNYIQKRLVFTLLLVLNPLKLVLWEFDLFNLVPNPSFEFRMIGCSVLLVAEINMVCQIDEISKLISTVFINNQHVAKNIPDKNSVGHKDRLIGLQNHLENTKRAFLNDKYNITEMLRLNYYQFMKKNVCWYDVVDAELLYVEAVLTHNLNLIQNRFKERAKPP